MVCPVCGKRAFSRRPWAVVRGIPYHRCASCSYVWLDPSRRLGCAEEEARYRKHRNDPGEPGYRAYLEDFIARAVLPYAAPEGRVLDFGSGPGAPLALLLRGRGFDARTYDPFFAPDKAPLSGAYGLIAVHETAEHLGRPYREFSRLRRLLEPRGRIAVRTLYAPREPGEFARWWYREDPTHVGFFGSRPLAALASRLGMDIVLDDGRQIAVLEKPG